MIFNRVTVLAVATVALAAQSTLAITNEAGLALLKTLDADSSISKHDSGFYYKVLSAADPAAPFPEEHSRCNMSYLAKVVTGENTSEAFDGTREPRYIVPSKVFLGFRRLMMAMRPGDKWEVTMPPELAFGDGGHGKIPGGSVIIFDVEMHDMTPPPEGVWFIYDWIMSRPLWILIGLFLFKFVVDWYLGVKRPSGPLIPQKMLVGQPTNAVMAFEMTVDGKAAGTINVELFCRLVPQTIELFQTVCLNNLKKPKNKKATSSVPNHKFEAMKHIASQTRLSFESAHSVEAVNPKAVFVALREYTKGYATHDSRYLLSLANVESITVDKKIEFFFTLAPAEVYDGNHVVFGAVKSGQSVFDAIEQAHKNGETVQIAKCSLVEGQAIDKKSQ